MFAKALATALVAAPFASAAIIDVFVGGTGILKFTPDQVTANPGDSIRFTFGVKNHTTTQSTFASPCTPMAGGFNSGYMPVAANQTTDLPQFWIPVRDTKPIWAFCAQANHCQQGMVFAVNAPPPPAANSFQNYLAAAMGTAPPAAAPPAAAPPASSAAPPASTTAPDVSTTSAASDPYGGGAPNTTPAAGAPPAATSAPSTAPNNAVGSPTIHTIVVGGSAGLVYTQNNIQAAIGDVVQFQFQIKNHTVTQSTFKDPCTPEAGGFDSGYMPVSAGTTNFPTYSITINDTKPIWGFCKQANHCQQGMVFAINANESSPNTFAAFQAAAKASTPGSSSNNSNTPPANSALGGAEAGGWRFILSTTLVVVSLGFGVLL